MSKKRIDLLQTISLSMLLVISLNCALIAQEPSVSKQNSTTYLIRSLADLNEVANRVNDPNNWWKSSGKTFILEADISGFTNMIGTEASPFKGIFDGNNHIITVNIYKPTINRVALFGRADNATITQLTVAGSVRGAYDVGGVLGFCMNVTVSFCTNAANVLAKDANGTWGGWAGGIASGTYGTGLTILNCANTGTIEGSFNVGGIVGDGMDITTIISCINIGTIRGAWRWIGGIIGRDPYEVENCMNAGFVVSSGDGYVGGIVGFCNYDRAIKNCLNTGVVHNFYPPAGAIVGYMPNHSLLHNNYYDKQMCTKGSIAGDTTNTIATGLNTEDLTGYNPFGTQWQVSGTNFYPVPTGGNAGVGNSGYFMGIYNNDCVSHVAAATIVLQSLPTHETTDSVIARFFLSYHPYNTGANTWTAKNGTVKLIPPSRGSESMWDARGPARADTMVASCLGYSKQVPLNIPRLIQKSASFAETSTNFAFSVSEVTPNIVTDNATIDIQTATEGNLNVSIYDLAGTKVANITDRYIDANSALQINLNNLFNLSAGAYMAVVSVGNDIVMRKFVKQ